MQAGGGQAGATLTEAMEVSAKQGSFVVFKFGEM